MSTTTAVTLSHVIFTALLAAEKDLPPESRALIEAHDVLYREWISGYVPEASFRISPALEDARAAIRRDPLAEFCMELRKQANAACFKEREIEQPSTNKN